MKGIVLAGGFATRLRPISYALPKLLFPVFGKPMIHWSLDLLKSVGTEEVILGVNYLAETLRRHIGSEYRGMSIKYSLETEPLGTAGPIKLASTDTRLDETFIVMNGDVIAQINLREMLKQHKETKALITDALHEVKDPTRFGVVQLDAENRIRRFVEKPKQREAPSRLVNAGIYLIEPDVLQTIAPDQKVSLEREIFPPLAEEGRLGGFTFSGHWFDIGNLVDFRKANFAMLLDSEHTSTEMMRNVDKDAVIGKSVFIGENSRVSGGTFIGPKVIVGNNSSIAKGARVSESILFDRVTIGERSVVSGAILANDVSVGKRARIGPGCVISPNVKIADGVKIGPRAIIHPYKEINSNVRTSAHVM
ncbi:MAG: sugar phosphate nucleotidyltransferase [Candidatus Bathyarchaeia archaeon]